MLTLMHVLRKGNNWMLIPPLFRLVINVLLIYSTIFFHFMFVLFLSCENRLLYFKTGHRVKLLRGMVKIIWLLVYINYKTLLESSQVKKTYSLANFYDQSPEDEVMSIRKLKGDIKITEM